MSYSLRPVGMVTWLPCQGLAPLLYTERELVSCQSNHRCNTDQLFLTSILSWPMHMALASVFNIKRRLQKGVGPLDSMALSLSKHDFCTCTGPPTKCTERTLISIDRSKLLVDTLHNVSNSCSGIGLHFPTIVAGHS